MSSTGTCHTVRRSARRRHTVKVTAGQAVLHTGRVVYSEELAERVRERLAGESGVSEKRMFGGLAFLVGGYMTVTISGEGGLMLRVDPAQTAALLAEPNTEPVEMRGRELDGWIRIDEQGIASDADLARWTAVGVDYVRTRPPKRPPERAGEDRYRESRP